MHTMLKECFISLYLDTRREKKNGKYPVKLRVFTPTPRRQKLYTTAFEFTIDDFQSIWETKKPRKEHREIRFKLQVIENKAQEIASKLQRFTFERFEQLLFSSNKDIAHDVCFYFKQAIDQYKRNKQIGTASNYDLSLKSLLAFHKKESLSFYTITPQWLKDYEDFMINTKQKSRTTVGFYLRPLRAIFNTALSRNLMDPDTYPFGKRKYQIPAPKGVKKALTKEQLKLLLENRPSNFEQHKAKSFWFFSYASNGMNIKDIANLKYKDISGDTLIFRRAKTVNTNSTQAPIIVYLNKFTRNVIEEYGNRDKSPESFIFNIIDHTTDPETQHRQLKIFIRFINQHFKKLAQSLGIKEGVSTYWARHSYATNAIRSGASIEYVSESLGHNNLSTTRAYFSGFEDEKKREIANKLMEF